MIPWTRLRRPWGRPKDCRGWISAKDLFRCWSKPAVRHRLKQQRKGLEDDRRSLTNRVITYHHITHVVHRRRVTTHQLSHYLSLHHTDRLGVTNQENTFHHNTRSTVAVSPPKSSPIIARHMVNGKINNGKKTNLGQSKWQNRIDSQRIISRSSLPCIDKRQEG